MSPTDQEAHDKHSENKANADSQSSGGSWRSDPAAAFAALFIRACTYFWNHPVGGLSLVVGMFCLTPLFDTPDMNPRRQWYTAIGFWLILGGIIYFIFDHEISRRIAAKQPAPAIPRLANTHAYSVKILSQMGPNTEDPVNLWFANLDEARRFLAVTRISVGAIVEFTNDSDDSYIVTSYSIDVECADGSWQPAGIIPVQTGQLFTGDLRKALAMQLMGAYFDTLLRNKAIRPKQLVKGWIFLDFPGPTPIQHIRIRPTFEDLHGEGITTVELPTTQQLPSLPQTDLFRVEAGIAFDLSGIRVVPLKNVPSIPALPPVRHLNADQRQQIVSAIRQFAGSKIVFITDKQIGEPAAYASQISEVFSSAGWDAKKGMTLVSGIPKGITIWCQQDKEKSAALNSIQLGFDTAGIKFDGPHTGAVSEPITIFVGEEKAAEIEVGPKP